MDNFLFLYSLNILKKDKIFLLKGSLYLLKAINFSTYFLSSDMKENAWEPFLKYLNCWFNIFKISVKKDSNGDPLLDVPAIVFEDTKCKIYSNYKTKTLLDEYDRFEINQNAYTISDIYNLINNTGYFEIELLRNTLCSEFPNKEICQ